MNFCNLLQTKIQVSYDFFQHRKVSRISILPVFFYVDVRYFSVSNSLVTSWLHDLGVLVATCVFLALVDSNSWHSTFYSHTL